MADITISVPHSFSADEVLERTRKGLERMAGKMGLKVAWQGTTASIGAPGVKQASVQVGPSSVEIEVTLALMAKPMKGMVEQQIKAGIERALAG